MAGETRRRRVSKVRLGNSCLTTSVVPFMSHTDTEHRGTRIGYTRVSTVAQTLDQQNEALTAANVTKTFSDTMSGARDDRPGLGRVIGLRPRWRHGGGLEARQVGPQHAPHPGDGQRADGSRRHLGVGHRRHRFVHRCWPHDDRRPGLAEYERELVKERTALKRASSRANGTKFGRPARVMATSTSQLPGG
jgi:hypothetical protein